MTTGTHRGSCLCGQVHYTVSNIVATSHCHCSMCRKAHGAAFATYASALNKDHVFTAGAALVKTYKSSAEVTRSFCSACGSPLLWHSNGEFAAWVSFPLAALDTPYLPPTQKHIHVASRVPWFSITDGWPQTAAY
jgi:hypothetical protein